MALILILGGVALLIAGLVGVCNGNWRVMWVAQTYMVVFVTGSWTVDYWYQLVGMNRGDGFALLGVIVIGSMAAAVSVGVLAVAGIIHSLRGKYSRAAKIERKSEVA